MNGHGRAASAARHLEALKLRQRGLTYGEIAERIGYANSSVAYKAVMLELKRQMREPAEQVRELEIDRLDRMLLALQPKIDAGDTRAIDTALRIMERRARLLGLDAPQSIDVTSKGDALITRIEIAPVNDPAAE